MIVQAGTYDIVVHRDVIGRGEAAIGAAIQATEIDMQIFRLGAPIAGQRNFKAGADGPAGIGRAVPRETRHAGADIADRETTGEVGHDAAERVAGAAAHGREPGVARAATWAERRVAGAAEV